jgi:hypothetical protein
MSKPTQKQIETFYKILEHGRDTRLVDKGDVYVIMTPSGEELSIHQSTARALIDKRMVQANWVDDRPGYLCASPDVQEVSIPGASAWHQEWDPTVGVWRVETEEYCPFRVRVQIKKSEREEYLCYATAKTRKRNKTSLSVFIEIRGIDILVQEGEYYATIPGAIKKVLECAKDTGWVERELCWTLQQIAHDHGVDENAIWRARYGDRHVPSKAEEAYNLFALVKDKLENSN